MAELYSLVQVCVVAPIPGQTKVWQYITLMKRVYLIDCPGVVYNETNDSIVDTVLKGVVRIERLEDATQFIPEVLKRVKPEYLVRVHPPSTSSGSFVAEILVRSPRKLSIFIIYKKCFPDQSIQIYFLFNFENRSTVYQLLKFY